MHDVRVDYVTCILRSLDCHSFPGPVSLCNSCAMEAVTSFSHKLWRNSTDSGGIIWPLVWQRLESFVLIFNLCLQNKHCSLEDCQRDRKKVYWQVKVYCSIM